MVRTLLVLALLPGLLGAVFGRTGPEDLPELEEKIRQRFPEVRQMSPAELERRLDAGEDLLLLDVRAPEEHAVSHLPGAVRAETEAEARAALAGVGRDRPVVTYCSVGYRSSQMAQTLREMGFTDVANLEGSIFAWANSGRTVVGSDGEPVEEVHPYDRKWGRYLRPELRAF